MEAMKAFKLSEMVSEECFQKIFDEEHVSNEIVAVAGCMKDKIFIKEFGMPDQDTSAAHAISEFFSNGGKAATFCRILGTGSSNADGTVGFAGFKLSKFTKV